MAIIALLSTPAAASTSCEMSGTARARLECYEGLLCGGESERRSACLERIVLHLLKGSTDTRPQRTAGSESREQKGETADSGRGFFGWFGASDGKAKSGDLRATIVRAVESGYDQHILWLDNGQIWETYDPRRIPLEKGDAVTIVKGVLGARRVKGPQGILTGVIQVDCEAGDNRRKCQRVRAAGPREHDAAN